MRVRCCTNKCVVCGLTSWFSVFSQLTKHEFLVKSLPSGCITILKNLKAITEDCQRDHVTPAGGEGREGGREGEREVLLTSRSD